MFSQVCVILFTWGLGYQVLSGGGREYPTPPLGGVGATLAVGTRASYRNAFLLSSVVMN